MASLGAGAIKPMRMSELPDVASPDLAAGAASPI
jgi:hypothetical protein